MTKIKVQIGDLVDYYNKEDSVGNRLPINDKIFIKDMNGSLVPIGACIKKHKEPIIETVFKSVDSERTISMKTSAKHAVWNGITAESVKDVKNIILANGDKYLKTSMAEVDNDYLYDISVPAPHLYQTPNGVIHHNTSYALIMAQAFQAKYKDGVILFYDSEYGSPQGYFEQFGVDTSRVMHTPIMNVEELKFDLIAQLDGITKTDKVMILIDSVGNLASKKEIDDAQNEKSVADMTRAKQMKSLWRMATPYFKKFDIPCVAINHTYQCGTEKMTVTTPDSIVSIKYIKKGDKVLTTEGYEEVQFTTIGEDASITEIELENGEILEFTAGHRFKVNGDWVYVGDLEPGMELDSVEGTSLKIKSINHNTRKETVYDFETPSHNYILGNGLISHNTQEMFSKAVVSGGTGGIYSSDTIFIIGKSQEKTGKDITGYNFTINIEKSRFVKEKSKFLIRANWDGGILKYHGFLEDAMEGGYVDKPKVGWYSRPCVPEDKNWREKDTTVKEWWTPILENTDFAEYLKKKYKISHVMPDDSADFLDKEDTE